MNLQDLYEFVVTNGLASVGSGLGIFAVVWFLNWVGFLNSGTYKRIGVVIGTALLSGYEVGDVAGGAQTILTLIIAVIVNEFKGFLTLRKATATAAPPTP